MRNRPLLWCAVALLILLGSVWQVVSVYQLQLDHGASHSSYSTYRADPWGLRAWYGALDALPGVTVRRNEVHPERLEEGAGRALIYAGAMRGPDPRTLLEATERFVASGGHLVIAYHGISTTPEWTHMERARESEECPEGNCDAPPAREKEDSGEAKADGEADEEEGSRDAAPARPAPMDDTEDRWAYAIDFLPLRGDHDAPDLSQAKPTPDYAHLDASIPWFSGLHFTQLDDAWQVVYTRDTLPVVIRREWGLGTITLLADGYALTNEAMRHQRAPAYLAWLVAGAREIIFDEYHLGVRRDPNLMMLMRRHGLHYFLFALLAVALLFVWRAAVPLTPRADESRQAEANAPQVRGGQQEALRALLRRAVRPADLLATCARHWAESASDSRADVAAQSESMRHLLRDMGPGAPKSAALVNAYNLICRQLQKGTGR